MDAGSELDAAIAQKVMGLPLCSDRYGTDIKAAWQVIEKTDADPYNWYWSIRMGVGDAAAWVVQITSAEFGRVQADAETAPLAICRAALAAMNQVA